MTENMEKLVRRQARSPRSAAIAGIIYALLTGVSMILIFNALKVDPAEINSEWLEAWSTEAHVVLLLIPFAGIAFLLLVIASQAFFSRLPDSSRREKGFGWLSFGAAAGQSVGPILGGVLVDRFE